MLKILLKKGHYRITLYTMKINPLFGSDLFRVKYYEPGSSYQRDSRPKYPSWQSRLIRRLKKGMRWMQVKDKSSLPYIIIDSEETIEHELDRLEAEFPSLSNDDERKENISLRQKLVDLL